MSIYGLIMWCVMLLIGVPSAWRNPTAAALVGAWVFSKALFLATGDGLAVNFYVFPDIAALAIILAKPEYCFRGYDRSWWMEFKCILLERSPSDRAVMLLFPVLWWGYVADISEYSRYFVLWGASILQVLFASAESLETFWASRAQSIIRRHLGDLDAMFSAVFVFPSVFRPVPILCAADCASNNVSGGGGDG